MEEIMLDVEIRRLALLGLVYDALGGRTGALEFSLGRLRAIDSSVELSFENAIGGELRVVLSESSVEVSPSSGCEER